MCFLCSCSVDSLNNTDVVGSIVLCSPAEIISFSPRYDPYIAANNVIKANGAGIIYAMYTTNLLFFFESCNNYLVICAIVDFGIAREIQKYGNITRLDIFLSCFYGKHNHRLKCMFHIEY